MGKREFDKRKHSSKAFLLHKKDKSKKGGWGAEDYMRTTRSRRNAAKLKFQINMPEAFLKSKVHTDSDDDFLRLPDYMPIGAEKENMTKEERALAVNRVIEFIKHPSLSKFRISNQKMKAYLLDRGVIPEIVEHAVFLCDIKVLEQRRQYDKHQGRWMRAFGDIYGAENLELYRLIMDFLGPSASLGVRIVAFKEAVSAVALSPDMSYLAASGFSGEISIFSIESGSRECKFKAHDNYITDLDFDTDMFLLSSSLDCTVKRWEVFTGEEVCSYAGHERGVNCVKVSPTASVFLSGSRDRTLRLWGTQGVTLKTFKGHQYGIHSCDFSNDGLRAISGARYGEVKIWCVETGIELCDLKAHSMIVSSVFYRGNFCFTSSHDNSVCTWSQDGELKLKTEMSKGCKIAKSIIMHGEKHGILLENNSMKFFNIDTGTIEHTFHGHFKPISCCTISRNNRVCASGSLDGTVRLWDSYTGNLVAPKVQRHVSYGFNSPSVPLT